MTISRAERIAAALEEAFSPVHLTVEDESEAHRGHRGWREGGGTHLRIHIVAQAFAGKSRVERHRMVNAALAEHFSEGLHALAISAMAPGE